MIRIIFSFGISISIRRCKRSGRRTWRLILFSSGICDGIIKAPHIVPIPCDWKLVESKLVFHRPATAVVFAPLSVVITHLAKAWMSLRPACAVIGLLT
jgi:hypothetical protein